MKTRRIRMAIGRLAGTVQTVPATVAERLIASGQASGAVETEEGPPEMAADPGSVRHGDPVAEHRDPVPDANQAHRAKQRRR